MLIKPVIFLILPIMQTSHNDHCLIPDNDTQYFVKQRHNKCTTKSVTN
jgi:hypothetical protein